MNIRRTTASILLIALLSMLMLELPRAIANRVDGYRWFDPVVDVHGMILDDFVKNANRQSMQQAVIEAMIESLDDRYTEYVPPQLEEEFTKDLSGDYAGIGARISNRGSDFETEPLEIISPMIGSPALAAGVQPGDEILTIDGWETIGHTDSECIERLMGPPGTNVTVLLRHLDGSEEETVITRNRILTSNVFGFATTTDGWRHTLDDDGLIYVRIDQFTDRTVPQLRAVLDRHRKEGKLNGLILDLRENPGGALPAAVSMADLFLTEGEIVNIRSPRKDKTDRGRAFSARPGNTFADLPVVVLINENSASASEIVAGALSDHGRAKVLGERSFGKGSVQELRPIEGDNGILKLTTKYYYLPSGRHLQRPKKLDDQLWGVDPSPGCVVPESVVEARDRIRARRPFEAVGGTYVDVPDAVVEPWIVEKMKDAPLGEAVTLMRQRLERDAWPELPEDEDPGYISTMVQLENLLKTRELIESQITEINDEIERLEGLAETVDRGLGLEEDVELSEPVIAIFDENGALIGRWQVGADDDLVRSLSAVEMTRLESEESQPGLPAP